MSEKDTETVVLDEALLREIMQDGKPDADGQQQVSGRLIRLDPTLKPPASDDDDEADS